MFKPLSLRARALWVTLLVVLAPLPFVWQAAWTNARHIERMRSQLDDAIQAAQGALAVPGEPGAALEAIAQQHRVRMRLVGERGLLFESRDHDRDPSLSRRLGSLFFGPQGSPTLSSYDEVTPLPWLRPAVQAARTSGSAAGCETPGLGKSNLPLLLVCYQARRILRAGGGTAVLLAEQSERRTFRILYDVRYQLLRVTLYVLLIGVLLGSWFGWRLVRPIHRLRAQVLSHMTHPDQHDFSALESSDEFGDLARAFSQLLRSRAEQSRANEAFVTDLVHELKNPVAAIAACADALDGPVPLDPQRAQRLANVLRKTSRRLDDLVSRFLELARAEAGLPNEERSIVDLARLARGLIEGLSGSERYRDVRLRSQLGPAAVLGVPGRLESALLNLLDNAASFAGRGGWVAVRVTTEGRWAVVEVSDSGPGIAATDLSRIFGRFFTTRPGGHGTGLGLPLARALVEAHGGTLTATSPPGAGATFLMQLPMAPAAGSHPSDPARTQDDGCQDDGCQDDGCQDDG